MKADKFAEQFHGEIQYKPLLTHLRVRNARMKCNEHCKQTTLATWLKHTTLQWNV